MQGKSEMRQYNIFPLSIDNGNSHGSDKLKNESSYNKKGSQKL